MSASSYTQANIMAALFDGVAFPIPSHTWLALHTADSSATGENQVSTTTWPAYARVQAEQGGAMGTGWTAGETGVRTNARQIPFAAYNGSSDLTLTHWSIWDAQTGGNMLTDGPLTITRILQAGDLFEFDIGSLALQQS